MSICSSQSDTTDERGPGSTVYRGQGEDTFFEMKPNKLPGVDGFTARFFQKHWDLVRGAVMAAVLGFLIGGDMLEEVNRTLLVLIPKVLNLKN